MCAADGGNAGQSEAEVDRQGSGFVEQRLQLMARRCIVAS
jgi:hypothetical protein